MYKRLTPQQSRALEALRALGELTVTPDLARPLKALQRRGLVRYRRDAHGARIAVLRDNRRTRRRRSREDRWINQTWEALHADL